MKQTRRRNGPRCSYLYPDGHLVGIHETTIKGATVEHAVIREAFTQSGDWTGRIIIRDPGYLPMFRGARVDPRPTRVDGGSENTRRLGITVGNIVLHNAAGYACITTFPDLISCGVLYQPADDLTATFDADAEVRYWGSYPVSQVVAARNGHAMAEAR